MNRLFLLLFLLLSGCQNLQMLNDKPNPSVNLVETYRDPEIGVRITEQGSNKCPTFSPDGNRVAYISSKRMAHQNQQLYEYVISTQTERRVSFSDGDIEGPIYSELGDVIIYSSSTDELKERPLLFYPLGPKEHIPFDLYTSDPHGKNIERILKMNGRQFEISHIKGTLNDYVFLSEDKGSTLIVKKSLHSPNTQTLKKIEGMAQSPLMNKSGDLFWIQNQRLMSGKKGEIQLSLPVVDIKWGIADRNVLLILLQGPEKSEIRVYNEKQNCVALVLQLNQNILAFDYSAKAGKFALEIAEADRSHLYFRDMRAPELGALSCDPL